MKPKIYSTDINIQRCVKNSGGNQFNLIIAAAERARQISKRQNIAARDDPQLKQVKPITAALYEIQTQQTDLT